MDRSTLPRRVQHNDLYETSTPERHDMPRIATTAMPRPFSSALRTPIVSFSDDATIKFALLVTKSLSGNFHNLIAFELHPASHNVLVG